MIKLKKMNTKSTIQLDSVGMVSLFYSAAVNAQLISSGNNQASYIGITWVIFECVFLFMPQQIKNVYNLLDIGFQVLKIYASRLQKNKDSISESIMFMFLTVSIFWFLYDPFH